MNAACLARSVVLALLGAAWLGSQATPTAFLQKPYLQLGDHPRLQAQETMQVLWHAPDVDAKWSVQYKQTDASDWRDAAPPTMRRVAVPTVDPHRVYQATLAGLRPGEQFDYRVRLDAAPVFEARGRARRPASQPTRVVVFGDCAADTLGQRAIAYQAAQAKPDFLFITGDIVYSRGRIFEYRGKFFPVYNADAPDPAFGGPLLRSTLFIAAPGNHDIQFTDVGIAPDGLAYFYYWSQPLNGPLTAIGAKNTPLLRGPLPNQEAFLAAAAGQFPRMANFSFDYGNMHWLVLDSNPNVDWTSTELRQWIAKDLQTAKSAAWRIVAFHHPGFNSSVAHFNDQWMRTLAEVFEQNKVDIVFSGHVHNYQRSYPLRFKAERNAEGALVGQRGVVAGKWTLDKAYDGKQNTKPNGIVYIVTGAGGAGLYNPEQTTAPETWQEFTHKFVADTHSLTLVDVQGTRMSVRQVAADGRELDQFVMTK